METNEAEKSTVVALTDDGVSLRGRVAGKGPLIIAVHGGLGIDAEYLSSAFDSLRGTHTIVCFDQRGHGRSDGRESLNQSTRETLVDDIDAVRRHAGADRAIVFGHSYGGFLALEYAARYRDRVAGLALCATSASLDHIGPAVDLVSTYARSDELSALHKLLTDPPASDEEFASLWRAITPVYFADHESGRSKTFDSTRFSAAGYAAGTGWLSSYDMRSRLSALRVPIALFHGAHDWLMNSRTAGNELCEALPGATRFVFEQSGHYPFIEEPRLWERRLSEWLSELRT